VDPVYVTQTTIAVTILHKIHYSIEVPKTNNSLSPKEGLNSDSQQFHQYQQNNQ
jgi:hypothetical protein